MQIIKLLQNLFSGKSDRAIRRESGSIGAPVATLTRVTLVDYTFTSQTTHSNASMQGKN